MKALVNLVVGVALIVAYLSVHPTRQPGDIGREYIAVTQALADPKLPANDRTLLEMRRDTVAASIRSAYSDQLTFETKLVPLDAKNAASKEREIRITGVTQGRFSDYDWSVGRANLTAAIQDEKDPSAGLIRFTTTDNQWTGVTAKLKTDPLVNHQALVLRN